MNRVIKFRGLSRLTKEWLIGDLFQHRQTGDYVLPDNIEGEDMNLFNVVTETIGQFTGVQDKNGKDIYEGDIVRFYKIEDANKSFCEMPEYFIEEVIDEVVFLEGQFCLKDDPTMSLMYLVESYRDSEPRTIDEEYGYLLNKDKYPFIKTTNDIFFAEVIGNKHDNPELLKGGDNE